MSATSCKINGLAAPTANRPFADRVRFQFKGRHEPPRRTVTALQNVAKGGYRSDQTLGKAGCGGRRSKCASWLRPRRLERASVMTRGGPSHEPRLALRHFSRAVPQTRHQSDAGLAERSR